MIRLCFILLILPVMTFADINRDLNSFFNHVGSSSHVDSGEIYNGQKAGYMTGGGFMTRNRVVDTQLVSVNLPRFDAGCGGIDIFAGGFSFINHDQLVHTLKSIASNAVGYSFLLGLETASPQIVNIIKQLQTWSNTINSIGINSCDTATNLVGSVWPRQTAAKQQICKTQAGKNGRFSDYVLARHKCSESSEYEQMMNKWGENADYEDMLKEEYNIAWKAIQKQSFLSKNIHLAELFMTLTGTIIVRKDENHSVFERWPARINDDSFLQALIEGGTSQMYSCADSQDKSCLNLVLQEMTVERNKSWLGKIQASLLNMQNKILSDQELDESDKELLAKSKLPLYKIVNVLTAYKKGACPIDLCQVAEIVAMDLFLQTLREIIEVMRMSASQVQMAQMYDFNIKEYLDHLDRIEDTVRQYEIRISEQMEREFQMMLKIDRLEQQIASEIVLW